MKIKNILRNGDTRAFAALPTDDEVVGQIMSVPAHFSNATTLVPIAETGYNDISYYGPAVSTSTTYYESEMLGWDSNGYLTHMDDSAAMTFAGIHEEVRIVVDGTSIPLNGYAMGGTYPLLRVKRPYRMEIPLASGTVSRAQAQQNVTMYAADNGHVTTSSGTFGNVVGVLVDVQNSSSGTYAPGPGAPTGDIAVIETAPIVIASSQNATLSTLTVNAIQAGDSSLGITGATSGGAIPIVGGQGSSSGTGGAVSMTAGAGGSSSGTGGAASLIGGAGTAGNSTGGAGVVTGGAGQGTGTGGAATIAAGASGAGATGNGGVASLTGGAAASTNGTGGIGKTVGGAGTGTGAGGAAQLTGGLSGAGATGNGGAATIAGGAAASTNGSGGAGTLTGGLATGTGTGGAVTLTGGSSGGASGTGGSVNLASGAAAGGTVGAVNVQTVTTGKLGFYGATAVVKHTTTGDVTGFIAGSGTTAKSDSVFAGAAGATAYTVGDLVTALKAYGLLTA